MKIVKTINEKPIALVACCADPSSNPRPNRAIKILADSGYYVIALSFRPKNQIYGLSQVFEISYSAFNNKTINKLWNSLVVLTTLLKINFLFADCIKNIFWGLFRHRKILKNKQISFILAEDIVLLPFCYLIKTPGCPIVLDAREYYPREYESSFRFRLFQAPEKKRLCKKYIPKINHFYTVSEGLAQQYKIDFGRLPDVIRSTPFLVDALPNAVSLPIRLVHHGGANRDRQLEKMIDVVNKLDKGFTLDFYLVGDPDYITELKQRVADHNRIKFFDPVPFVKIIDMLQKYDIGFYLLTPTGFNTKYALPNKFFEYIQARLAIAIGPSPEMKKLVEKYDMGIVSKDFTVEAMFDNLKNLSAQDVFRMKQNAHLAATELCWEQESKKLLTIIDESKDKNKVWM